MPGMTTNPNFTVSENRRIQRIFFRLSWGSYRGKQNKRACWQSFQGLWRQRKISWFEVQRYSRSYAFDKSKRRTFAGNIRIKQHTVILQKEEYFEKREIKLMLTLISLINNHIQDIPLVSVMRSPIGNFTENELSKIRLENRTSSFYNAVKYYKSSSDDLTKEEQKLSKNARAF